MEGYFGSNNKYECTGCEACMQICPKAAIVMKEDSEGFRYPEIDNTCCIECRLCERVCPMENEPSYNEYEKYVYGGYLIDQKTRFESTSGGAFSAIVDAFCDSYSNYAIFGAQAKGLMVFHSYITDKKMLGIFRKSKYTQSIIGNSYKQTKKFLSEGRKVLFSGTPCQIAGLYNYLNITHTDTTDLLTVEVVCEGVPSPLYIKKYNDYIKRKYGQELETIDYRYKGKSIFSHGKWDFQVMRSSLADREEGRCDFDAMGTKFKNNKVIEVDRWFNPFWSVWLKHLMSRPSCYECPYAKQERTADITLGDLWGVHIYCPELYGENGGASLVIANNKKSEEIVKKAQKKMYGHKLRFEDALRYQGPIRNHIAKNPQRQNFMQDLESNMIYEDINKKWASKPTLILLFQKYIWGNRQKMFVWNLRHRNKHVQTL